MIKVILMIFVFVLNIFAQKISIDSLETHIKKSFTTFDPIGLSVAIVRDGEVIYMDAFGFEDVDKKSVLSTKSLFNIASCTKAFTSTMMGMMIDENKVAWRDKVSTFLPKFKLANPYIAQNLNIVDILSHRSGFKTYIGDLLWYRTNYSNEEIIERMQYLSIDYGFRERYGYQNNMFTVAGEIIEKVSDNSWTDNLQNRIFNKLNMNGSRPSQNEILMTDKVAMPHRENTRIMQYKFVGGKPAASIYSNVEDVSKWLIFNLNDGIVVNDTLIQKNSLHFLRQTHFPQPVSNFWKNHGRNFSGVGLGWKTSDYHGNVVVEHSGGMPGYVSKVAMLPRQNSGFVILNNDEHSMVNLSIYFQILDFFCQDSIKDWPQELNRFLEKANKRSANQKEKRLANQVEDTEPSFDLKNYSGKYRDKWYGDALVEYDDDLLSLTLMPAKEIFTGKLEHWHYNTFKVQFKDTFLTYGLVTFHLNSNGEISGFTIDLPVADFHFGNLDFKKIE